MERSEGTDSEVSEETVDQEDFSDKKIERPSAFPRAVNPADALWDSSADRYELRRKLGAGSMGMVTLCRDRRIGREVAKKVLSSGRLADHTLHARFLRECRIQGQLEHPSIVPVYDLGVDEDGAAFFTMKCLRGMTLKQILQGLRAGDPEVERRFTIRRLLGAFSSVCLAVDFAHARGVLHRDLKPSNVMLGNFGEVYVLDWGIAKLKQEIAEAARKDTTLFDAEDTGHRRVDAFDDIHTAAGRILGTFGYMAPEQARGAISEIDARSDVYSLGAILFELLTLEPLHPRTTWKQMMLSTLRGVSARPSERAPRRDVPPELEEICVKATRADPQRRFQSVRELHEAVERYLDGDRDMELRLKMAAAYARNAEEQAASALAGAADDEASRRQALQDLGRALALDPENTAAAAVLRKLVAAPPTRVPREVDAAMKSTALARCRFQLREGIRFDLGLLLVLVPLALWMGILDTWITPCAVLFMLASAGLKLLASRAPSMDRSQQFGYGAYLLNVASQLCVGRAFGPLFFTPVMLSFFTLGACVSHTGRYRAAIVTTGALALLGAVLVEVLGVIPPSYAFTDVDALRMTIVAHAVRLPEVPTITALTVAGLAMILGTGFMIARVLGVLQEADRRSALWAWQLKHLLPDEAHAPMSPPRR